MGFSQLAMTFCSQRVDCELANVCKGSFAETTGSTMETFGGIALPMRGLSVKATLVLGLIAVTSSKLGVNLPCGKDVAFVRSTNACEQVKSDESAFFSNARFEARWRTSAVSVSRVEPPSRGLAEGSAVTAQALHNQISSLLSCLSIWRIYGQSDRHGKAYCSSSYHSW